MHKAVWILLTCFGLGVVVSFVCRRGIILSVAALTQREHPLSPPVDVGAGVEWFDDNYTIERIDLDTIAIGEPRYHQQNYSYLILGKSRAVLLDSDPGVRDITPVVKTLTLLSVTAVASHLHFDHIGNHSRFESLAMVDLPYLRGRAEKSVFHPARNEHLGYLEGIPAPFLRVTEWWAPDSVVDLGGRKLHVIHTPGHSDDSISLLDEERGQLFTGDYINQGALFAFLPGSRLSAYLTGIMGMSVYLGRCHCSAADYYLAGRRMTA